MRCVLFTWHKRELFYFNRKTFSGLIQFVTDFLFTFIFIFANSSSLFDDHQIIKRSLSFFYSALGSRRQELTPIHSFETLLRDLFKHFNLTKSMTGGLESGATIIIVPVETLIQILYCCVVRWPAGGARRNAWGLKCLLFPPTALTRKRCLFKLN